MLTDFWYVAAFSRELVQGQPLGRTFFNKPVVLFRDRAGTAHAVGAICPHRGANLADGKVVGDNIQCPYHGWEFEHSGRCARIPSLNDNHSAINVPRVPPYATREQLGFIWICMGDVAFANRAEAHPAVDALQDSANLLTIQDGPHHVNASYLNCIENFMDETHPHFVHQNTFGAFETPQVPTRKVEFAADKRSFTIPMNREESYVDTSGSLLQRWLSRFVYGSGVKQFDFAFEFGGAACFYARDGAGRIIRMMSACATPINEYETWFFTEWKTTPAAPGLRTLQRRYLRWYLEETNREDKQRLSTLLVQIPDAGNRELSAPADAPGLALRRAYKRFATTAPTGEVASLEE